MRVMWVSTSTNNVETVINSLDYLGTCESERFRYDANWNRECQLAIQQNPQVKDFLQIGAWPPAEQREAWRSRVRMDATLLKKAREFKPDVILYVSAWEGLFVVGNETLTELNTIAPLVHFCFDASDPPWWPQMEKFERDGCFSLTINIDGGHWWPGEGEVFTGLPPNQIWFSKLKNTLTLLTPVDARAFGGPDIPFLQRAYPVGYGGNAGGWLRSSMAQQFQKKGWAVKLRDDNPGSYGHYCQFLKQCRVSISIPFTGSTAATHVKGRVVESGYAGACLLEWKNDATRAWFTPRHEFEEYESPEECLEMAEWLSAHPKRCEEIARNLHHRMTTEHSPQAFWSAVWNKLGLVPTI